jgi:hypothetical protein
MVVAADNKIQNHQQQRKISIIPATRSLVMIAAILVL